MAAPGVAVAIVTSTGGANVPPAGVMTGAATVPSVIQTLAAPLSLSSQPAREAIALIVLVALTVIGATYTGDVAVGSEPSTVYRIVVAGVVVETATVWGEPKLPPFGEKVGRTTFIV